MSVRRRAVKVRVERNKRLAEGAAELDAFFRRMRDPVELEAYLESVAAFRLQLKLAAHGVSDV